MDEISLILLTQMRSRGVCGIAEDAEVSLGVGGCWEVVE
jgi:hypothetical protein